MRPYTAAFASRFQQMLQYRSAALAGFATQCWWGSIKVTVLAAFYTGAAATAGGARMPLAEAITYTWLAQGLLALLPWVGDPEVAQAVRTGSVVYDRAWQPPAGVVPALLFVCAAILALLLSVAMVMLLNVATVAALNERGVNALAMPVVVVFSGNLLPLSLLPDIPVRLYFGHLTGWNAVGGLALQAGWIAVLIVAGRAAMQRTMRTLEVQGG